MCLGVWVYVCMCVCVYGCMGVWVYGCMDVCVYARTLKRFKGEVVGVRGGPPV